MYSTIPHTSMSLKAVFINDGLSVEKVTFSLTVQGMSKMQGLIGAIFFKPLARSLR